MTVLLYKGVRLFCLLLKISIKISILGKLQICPRIGFRLFVCPSLVLNTGPLGEKPIVLDYLLFQVSCLYLELTEDFLELNNETLCLSLYIILISKIFGLLVKILLTTESFQFSILGKLIIDAWMV